LISARFMRAPATVSTRRRSGPVSICIAWAICVSASFFNSSGLNRLLNAGLATVDVPKMLDTYKTSHLWLIASPGNQKRLLQARQEHSLGNDTNDILLLKLGERAAHRF
jgi:hypothetical protein